jgi:hypothetical protein
MNCSLHLQSQMDDILQTPGLEDLSRSHFSSPIVILQIYVSSEITLGGSSLQSMEWCVQYLCNFDFVSHFLF